MHKFPAWPYQTVGEQRNPPLVFLHGFMGTGADWRSIAERCANRFFCLIPDLPGHGKNTNFPLSQPLSFDIVITGLNQLFEQLDLEQINLAGYSMGGRLALYAAMQFPHKINTLVLESANPGLIDEQARRARTNVDDERTEMLLRVGIDAFVDQWYEMGLFNSLKQHTQLLEQTKAKRKQNDPRWAAKIISALSPGRQPPLWHQLNNLSMPVLLIAGALDTKYVGLVQKMGGHIPQAIIKIIPDAGHNIHLENPQQFTQLLTNFLL